MTKVDMHRVPQGRTRGKKKRVLTPSPLVEEAARLKRVRRQQRNLNNRGAS